MGKEIAILVFLIAHIIGDYYLQSNEIAIKKQGNPRFLVWHIVVYGIPFIVLGFIATIYFKMDDLILPIACCILAHAFIDTVKYLTFKYDLVASRNAWIYCIDQASHLVCIMLIVKYVVQTDAMLSNPVILDCLKWMLLVLVLFKPTNVTFRFMFETFQTKPKDITQDIVGKDGAGARIGSLERILMILFIYLNQFSAIGLVLTAKSIARYKQISDDPAFAEYYLMGTLYSVIATIMMYILLIQLNVTAYV